MLMLHVTDVKVLHLVDHTGPPHYRYTQLSDEHTQHASQSFKPGTVCNYEALSTQPLLSIHVHRPIRLPPDPAMTVDCSGLEKNPRHPLTIEPDLEAMNVE